ncbi:MAG: hypothetical protein M3N32_03130 [Actinomycetota bacterium]|nr:hypothetical protein [Actinomycetota bacterium]
MREDDGDHHPENLAYLARRWHLLVHRHGWEQHPHPQTGELTITPYRTHLGSLPRGALLGRPPASLGAPGEPDNDQE